MADPAGNGGNGLILSGWGASIRATGSVVVVIVVLMLGFGGVAWILHEGFGELQKSQTSILDELTTIETQHFSQEYAQRDLACVLAMPTEMRISAIVDPLGACHFATGYAVDVGRRAPEGERPRSRSLPTERTPPRPGFPGVGNPR